MSRAKNAKSAVHTLAKLSLYSSELKDAVPFVLSSIDREGLTLRLHSCVRDYYMNLVIIAVDPWFTHVQTVESRPYF